MLKNKTAVVTGAATGIGEGVARLFASHGAHVILLDRDAARNQEVAASIQGQAFECDVSDGAAIARVFSSFPTPDILINNAGIYPRQTFIGMTESQWDEMQEINLKSIFRTMQAVMPGMVARGSGKVVNISSVTFHLGAANLSHYVASKGGVIGLTRSVAREVGPSGVHINCITPGAILVEAEKKVVTDAQAQEMVDQQSLKRRLVPLDIARVCLFLSTELSDGMTGQTLNVDAGWIMH